MRKEEISGGGIGIGGIVFTVLLVLKLIGEIEMGWFLIITSLIWAPLIVLFVIIIFFVIIFAIGYILSKIT
jgi:hypothetical protein